MSLSELFGRGLDAAAPRNHDPSSGIFIEDIVIARFRKYVAIDRDSSQPLGNRICGLWILHVKFVCRRGVHMGRTIQQCERRRTTIARHVFARLDQLLQQRFTVCHFAYRLLPLVQMAVIYINLRCSVAPALSFGRLHICVFDS